MDKAFQILNKTYNELLNTFGLDPDKYEREDAFMNIWFNYKAGKDIVESFKESFDLVHAQLLSNEEILSRLALCGGHKYKEILGLA